MNMHMKKPTFIVKWLCLTSPRSEEQNIPSQLETVMLVSGEHVKCKVFVYFYRKLIYIFMLCMNI